jgi:serine/threonine protein kinase
MFSLGMVIHFMAFRGRLPYTNTGETLEGLEDLRREVQAFPGYPISLSFSLRYTHDRQSDLPDELHELLRLLLSRQPDQRPTCQEVLKLMNTPHRKLSHQRNVYPSKVFLMNIAGYDR